MDWLNPFPFTPSAGWFIILFVLFIPIGTWIEKRNEKKYRLQEKLRKELEKDDHDLY